MARKLKLFNGISYAFGKEVRYYIAASSQLAAIAIARQALGESFGRNDLVNYGNCGCWGTPAEAVLGEPQEPGLWVSFNDSKFFRYAGRYDVRNSKAEPLHV